MKVKELLEEIERERKVCGDEVLEYDVYTDYDSISDSNIELFDATICDINDKKFRIFINY